MAEKVICQQCGTKHTVNTKALRQGFRCSNCGAVVGDDEVTVTTNRKQVMPVKNGGSYSDEAAPTTATGGTNENDNIDGIPQLKKGRVIGKCRIDRILGRGGMGIVYLARHLTLDIPVALKTLAISDDDSGGIYAKRFQREARLAARIRHPNVVQVLDVDHDPETNLYYMVQEYVNGGNVRDLMNVGRLTIDKAVEITLAMAEALEAAAQYKIIHRDIKPTNIMLDRSGVPKLADLGLAKADHKGNITIDPTSTKKGASGLRMSLEALTSDGTVMGTPPYMSPEQAIETKDVDARSDIYSLGATLYEMLTNEIPYPGESAIDILTRLFNDPVPDPRKLRPEIPAPLADICMKMLAKEKEDRHNDAASLVKDLKKISLKTPDMINSEYTTQHELAATIPIQAEPTTPPMVTEPIANLSRVLLEFEEEDAVRRVFIQAKPRIGFGKSKQASTADVDITLRLLPARSQAQDPENWVTSMKISRHHGNFIIKDGHAYIEPLSSNGIFAFPPEFDDLADAESIDEMAGTLADHDSKVASSAATKLQQNILWRIERTTHICLGTNLLHLRLKLLLNRDRNVLRGLHIRRLSNHPQHEYVQLSHYVSLGNMTKADIRMTYTQAPQWLAAIKATASNYVFRLIEGEGFTIDGKSIRPGTVRHLDNNAVLNIGSWKAVFRRAVDDDFVNVG